MNEETMWDRGNRTKNILNVPSVMISLKISVWSHSARHTRCFIMCHMHNGLFGVSTKPSLWCLELVHKAIFIHDLHPSWDFVILARHLLNFLILVLVAGTLKPCTTLSDVIGWWQNINLTWRAWGIFFNTLNIQKWRGLAAPLHCSFSCCC